MNYYDITKIGSREELYEAFLAYLQAKFASFSKLDIEEAKQVLISENNYIDRSQLHSCRPFGMTIESGDICWIDWGCAYQTEVGYQHLGLVINVICGKALVIPMTSNSVSAKQAYDPKTNPDGSKHLMVFGQNKKLNKPSVLFLNDAKFINTARIIEVTDHISKDSELFKEVCERFENLCKN